MAIPTISESTIKKHTAGGSFERGEEYLADGAVRSIEQVGENTLRAHVQGSDVHPYLVTIRFDEEDVTDVECTCPYHGGSWCKHAVAVLLKMLREGTIPKAESAAVSDLVSDLDRDLLIRLIERLAEFNPDLVDQIQRERERLTDA
jgi:uncharacterized Zn finger protein